MASGKEFLYYILDCLSEIDGIGYRAMMGDYVIYYGGKVVGGIFDNRFLVKKTRSTEELLKDGEIVIPYPHAKPMIEVADIEDRVLTAELMRRLYDELPFPEKRKKKQ